MPAAHQFADIVCDEDPTPAIMDHRDLWSGCIAGAFHEDRLLEHFEQAGFNGVEILARRDRTWQVIEGIEFRTVTVRALRTTYPASREWTRAWRPGVDDRTARSCRASYADGRSILWAFHLSLPESGQFRCCEPIDRSHDCFHLAPRETVTFRHSPCSPGFRARQGKKIVSGLDIDRPVCIIRAWERN